MLAAGIFILIFVSEDVDAVLRESIGCQPGENSWTKMTLMDEGTLHNKSDPGARKLILFVVTKLEHSRMFL